MTPERLTPQRLEEIRRRVAGTCPCKDCVMHRELLAEVDRLTRENRELRERLNRELSATED